MTQFGRYLLHHQLPVWAAQGAYVDYEKLKAILQQCIDTHKASPQDLQRIAALFQHTLDEEVQRVVRFYSQQAASLVPRVSECVTRNTALLESRSSGTGMDVGWLDACMAEIERLATECKDLLEYVSLNMAAIRKILKKYAKHLPLQDPTPGHLSFEIYNPSEGGWAVEQGSFLRADMADDVIRMQHHSALNMAAGELENLYLQINLRRRQISSVNSLRLPSITERALLNIVPLFTELDAAEAAADLDASFVRVIPWHQAAAGLFEPPPPEALAVATIPGLIINNASACLFMVNYTALIPLLNDVTARVGVPAAYGGQIMAASDAAALVASVAVSVWTNRSFKEPILFGAAACLVGNIVFCVSYARRSLLLLMMSRVLNGLGTARTANRRYTADYVSKSRRTMAAAAFVGASNLGMALGPALSIPLTFLPQTHTDSVFAFNAVTGVGWAMAVAWVAFLAATLWWFEDPVGQMPIGLATQTSVREPARASGGQGRYGDGRDVEQALLVEGDDIGGGEAQDGERSDDEGVSVDSNGDTAAQKGIIKEQNRNKGDWRRTIPGLSACVGALFVQKAAQQSFFDAVPLLTARSLHWQSIQNGIFLAVLSLFMLPVNLAVGAASKAVSDRTLVAASVAGMTLTYTILALWGGTSHVAFFAAGLASVMATVVLEGTATSLMSKLISPGFALGTWNAGLLSTEAGTLGRFGGNALLGIAGRVASPEKGEEVGHFCGWVFGGVAAMCGALVCHLVLTWQRLCG